MSKVRTACAAATSAAARAGTRYLDSVAVATGRQADEVIGAACSFSEDTPVATDSGFVPIGELDVGEMVLAWNQSLDSTDFYTVTAVWAHLDTTLVTLTIDGEQIETTPEHPFYIADNAWVAAGELWLGARVKKADGGVGTVSAITVVEAPQVMYNLTVSTAHTFFVGQEGWLVHNDCNIVPTDLHAFGNRSRPRPPRYEGNRPDIMPDPSTGQLPAQSPPHPDGASTFGDPNQAPLRGHYHRLPEGYQLPDGLGVVADGRDVDRRNRHRPTHHTIYPTREMTMDEFTELFLNLPWQYIDRKRKR